jgi:D-alanyl-D-alanine carboxypeptidase (penicillin-binding protein 5/6)
VKYIKNKKAIFAAPIIFGLVLVFVLTSQLYGKKSQLASAKAEVLGASTTSPADGVIRGIPLDSLQQAFVTPPTKPVQVSFEAVPKFNAKSILVYEPDSDAILFSQNSDEKLPVASLTKLMTALISYSDPDFTKPIVITSKDQVNVSPSLHLRVGDSVQPLDLMKAMLVGSANDAAQTLANHFPDSKTFIAAMNAKAQEIGLTCTHFSTPIGFDVQGNYSCASDMQKLVEYAMKTLPYDEIWKNIDYSFVSSKGNKYSIKNSNKLVLTHKNVRSIKTGFTNEAQGNMVAQIEGPNGNKVVAIILGAKNRDTETMKAANYAFESFDW